MIVGREGGRLQDEDILAAHVLLDFHEDFLVGKATNARLAQRNVEVTCDRLCQHPVGIAREEFHTSILGSEI